MNDSDILSDLEPITYTFNDDYSSSGIIATDICTVMPEVYTSMASTVSTISIGNLSYSDTISFPDINLSDIDFTEFEGMMPPIEKVKEMCEEYPALEKAYENFKLIYKLVHDDWVSQKENPHG